MGGGTSRFEETDWETADGRLTEAADTVDGSPPTSKYGVYYIHKRGVNQREYDVTDEKSNLLYTTRMIEGTLAWFDVLGPGIDQYILRVQVDLSRRYWVIYRFGAPAYAGQFADMTATTRLRKSRGEDQSCLYKKACITVSWSRYHAIVNPYGAPPPEVSRSGPRERLCTASTDDSEAPNWLSPASPDGDDLSTPRSPQTSGLFPNDQAETQEGHNNGEADSEAVKQADSEVKEDNQAGEHSGLESGNPQTQPLDKLKTTSSEQQASEDLENGDDIRPEEDDLSYDRKQARELPSLFDESPITKVKDPLMSGDGLEDEGNAGENGLGASETPYRDFSRQNEDTPDFGLNYCASIIGVDASKKKTKSRMKKLKKWVAGLDEAPPDPLEGYLLLDQPTLKCEEINSFMGQHQTMLVSNEEAKELEKEELRAAAEMGADAHNPDANYKHGIPQFAPKSQNEVKVESKKAEDKKSSFPRMAKLAKWMKSKPNKTNTGEASANATADDAVGESVLAPGEGTASREESLGVKSTAEEATSALENQGSVETSTSSSSKPNQAEPLVGFWNWDNTVRVHKMKLHVAKGSDLALHIVLAIVTNQLRYERNVVVSTV